LVTTKKKPAEDIAQTSDVSVLDLSIEVDEIKTQEDFMKRVTTILSNTGLEESEIAEEDVETVAAFEMSIMPKEMSISAGEKRQIKQYSPNDYHASVKLDISKMSQILLERLAAAEYGKRLELYMTLKKSMYQVISETITRHDDYLREIMHRQQKADGIEPT
jgi:hypothetical protein